MTVNYFLKGKSLRPLKILLLDDSSVLQKLQAKMFDSMGHETTVASGCESGVEIVRNQNFDIILMDINMPPGCNGLECTRKIRSMGIQTPIIALSGNSVESSKDECFAAGMNAYLEKPASKADFNALISALLE